MKNFSVEFRVMCDSEFADAVISEMGLVASHLRYTNDKFIWGYDGTDKYDEPIYCTTSKKG